MAIFLSDLKHGAQILRRNLSFAMMAIVPMSLVIGANTTVFTAVNALLLRPLPYREPDRLALLWESTEQVERASVSLLNFQDWRNQSKTFETMGVYRDASFNLTGFELPERVRGCQISAGALESLGVSPVAGQLFGSEEDQLGRGRVVLLSERFWRSRLGADPSVSGRSLVLDGEPFSILGVLPHEVQFPSADVDLWVPLGRDAEVLLKNRGQRVRLFVVGRLAKGVTLDQAQSEMTNIAARLAAQYPETNAGFRITVAGLQESEVAKLRPALTMLMAGVLCVLFVACANVTALLLIRAAARWKEMAVRASVGASRGRLIAQLTTESIVLTLASGSLGLLSAYGGLRALSALLPGAAPRIEAIGIDSAVLCFTLAISLLTGLLCGLVPALRLLRSDLRQALSASAISVTGKRGQGQLLSSLVALEVALAVVLSVAAGLALRSFQKLSEIDTGFQAPRVLTARLALPESRYADPLERIGFFRDLLERVQALPGVQKVGVSNWLPLTAGSPQSWVMAEGDPVPTPDTALFTLYQAVSPDYFQALGIPILEGRSSSSADQEGSIPVAMIDTTLAQRLWHGKSPLGKRVAFEFGGTPAAPEPLWREVVGVVRHVRQHYLDSEARPELYVPLQQPPLWFQPKWPEIFLVASSSGDPLALTPGIRRAVAAIDREQPVHDVLSLEQLTARELTQHRAIATLVGAFALGALLLSAIGLYGAIAYWVDQRTHEIGIRIALGAGRHDLLRLIVGRSLAVCLSGIAAGLLTTSVLGRASASLLYGVQPMDPVVYAVVLLLIVIVAFVASYRPVSRALRVDPARALKSE